ncbi:hypothetical protein CNMCM5793_005616 [Aspergillus hiratsukae]|uniref:Subtelomeric hrmA-associated cluster protein AFUB-079030/YDR124W-like helical bundle domain-containing protein n=1 Tax=Aspergillus hiratsukae TaxID=1194566 RepID=A0A8H6Q510_9EURO|nr:hypothetical protein CNMCM5793_005616 [Aspergillus hiratsukae]KAF7166571.1 hypothetical protein CNMCM6106_002346 [Aspergillus hiratsukae]
MGINNSSTLVQGPTKRTSHENSFTKFKNMIHYAIIFQDEDGAIKATGFGSFEDTHSWFTQELRESLQNFLPSGQPTQLTSDRPAKRCRTLVDDSGKQKAAVEVLPDCSNTQRVIARYRQNFSNLTQNDCRSIGQAWIDLIEPNKQRIHPYTKGDASKPNWWPPNVQHRSPHHLWPDDRITLLIHILRMSGKGKITCAELREAAVQSTAVSKTQERTLKILGEIFAIRENEERVETPCDHGVYQA